MLKAVTMIHGCERGPTWRVGTFQKLHNYRTTTASAGQQESATTIDAHAFCSTRRGLCFSMDNCVNWNYHKSGILRPRCMITSCRTDLSLSTWSLRAKSMCEGTSWSNRRTANRNSYSKSDSKRQIEIHSI